MRVFRDGVDDFITGGFYNWWHCPKSQVCVPPLVEGPGQVKAVGNEEGRGPGGSKIQQGHLG